ncbi:MAG: site-specific integrase [Tannerellaceae bacterium]|nr:site-specific integrase [Tannerellaceae bacterium]
MGYTELLIADMYRNGQERTANAYRTVAKGLVRFNKGEDIPLDQLNNTLIRSFENYLKQNNKMPNTVSYYMRNLRAIYNKAVADKRIPDTQQKKPFANVYTGIAQTKKRALSLEELKRLHQLAPDRFLWNIGLNSKKYRKFENLYRAWRLFFFCFYARGMSFIDLAYLRKDNIKGDILRYSRKKTGQVIELTLTPELKTILESFAKEVINSVYLFPIICPDGNSTRRQYENALRIQNVRLCKLALMAGIKKKLSTHVARHSWATIGKKQNIPIRVLSECLGHSSEKTTLIYWDCWIVLY